MRPEPPLAVCVKRLAPWPRDPQPLSLRMLGITAATSILIVAPMKIESFVGHHEARGALVLSIAGVTAIMLVESLVLLILY